MKKTKTAMGWEDEFEKRFSGQTQLSQAILSALEYRGFYDAGKYLDDDIADKILPIIKSFIRTVVIPQELEKVMGKVEKLKEALSDQRLLEEAYEEGRIDMQRWMTPPNPKHSPEQIPRYCTCGATSVAHLRGCFMSWEGKNQ